MNAWLTKDRHCTKLFLLHEPRLVDGHWVGDGRALLTVDAERAFDAMFNIQPGYCQEIELDAKPIGQARKGEG